MIYQPLHRRPRWHDRPRGWLAAAAGFTLGWLRRDWYEEDQELADDNGEPIARDLPPVRDREMIIAGKCESCWAQNRGEGCDWASCGCNCHDDDVYEDWDEPNLEPQVIRTAKVSGVHLPLSGGHVNPWVNCAFAREVMPAGSRDEWQWTIQGLVNVPRPGAEVRKSVLDGTASPLEPGRSMEGPGPGYLSMWNIIQVRSSWPPRPETVIISGPRIRPELRAALLAGTA